MWSNILVNSIQYRPFDFGDLRNSGHQFPLLSPFSHIQHSDLTLSKMATSHISIPELFKIVRHSFRESEFDEVEQILVEREKRIKIEMQDLQRDLDSTKNVARLLESSQGLAELEKLKIEEKLLLSQSKCQDLDEKLARLSEEHRVSCDRAKRAEERHETLSKEFSEMISENNMLILELNGKIKELQDKNSENEQLVVKYKEESKSLETKISNFDELRREKMESHNWVKNLGSRVMIMETELANMLNVKVEDLAILSDKFSPKEDLPELWKWKNAYAENVGTCNSTPLVAKGIIVLSKQY